MRPRPDVSAPRPAAWGRGKLLATLAGAGLLVAGLLTGLALAAVAAIADEDSTASTPTAIASTHADRRAPTEEQQRNALAVAPMPTAAPADALPHALSSRQPGVITLPVSTGVGPAGVPTGFPRTPEGALAQLASIDVTAMQSGSTDGVRAVIDAWSSPGGPTGQTWSGVRGMAALLSSASLSDAGSPSMAVVVRPAMGLIKGSVGPDFAVVCVDLEFTVTVARTTRIAIADCQRMTWTPRRWLIGAGPEPAPAPSVWPGTDLSIAVGYRELRHA